MEYQELDSLISELHGMVEETSPLLGHLGQRKFFKGNELFGIKGDYHGKPP